MGTPIPASCTNPFCRLTFFASQLFTILPGESLEIRDIGTICPRCGGTAEIKNGVYRVLETAKQIASTLDPAVLQRAIAFIRLIQSKQQPTELTKQEAKNEIPELSSLWDLIPKKRSEAYTILGFIITVILFLIAQSRTPKPISDPRPVGLPDEVISALQKLQPSAQPFSQQDTRKERSGNRRRRKEKP